MSLIERETPCDQLHLAWVEDTATTLTILWRCSGDLENAALEYRRANGDGGWRRVASELRSATTPEKSLRIVTLRDLSPSTAYEYRVQQSDDQWSEAYRTRTAPSRDDESAEFEAVFVADTGLAGRMDGLTTGTEDVISAVAEADPLVVLLGGDFAYYDTDRRFHHLEEAIDYYFNQMYPVASRAPLMPTYGNHELHRALQESFEPWAARFPTPDGFEDRRNYSFDVGNVHFISICAFEGVTALPPDRIRWVETDIREALAAGRSWIIPFFHVSPFAEGQNHPSNLQLRAQLGPLFEDLGIRLAISTHDQSYERSYPLRDVPERNTPTSASLDTYSADDGTIWMKVSPGGKMSNINGNFSQFRTEEPPHWTAVRNNTMHNFARLRFHSSGDLTVVIPGIKGDGSAPVELDCFTLKA